ncbi:MAG: signal peptidase I [Bifidobacteriaceae bacterium]|jgi:signal peptidase|nr:signal peptidase I [Bifidobacteriaceae bacterium]
MENQTLDRPVEAKRTFWRAFFSVFATALVVVVAVLAIAVAVVPKFMHGAALTVLSGSMEPTIRTGAVAVVKGVTQPEEEIAIGDVITFLPYPDDPTLITHRVISKTVNPSTGTTYITQGDANTAPDDPIMPKQIRGKYLYSIPYLGYLTSWGSNNVPWLVTAVGIALIIYSVVLLARSWRRHQEPSPNQQESAPPEGDDAPPSEPSSSGQHQTP